MSARETKRETRGKVYSYRNPWYTPTQSYDSDKIFTTSKKPVEYRGFQIFNRVPRCHELVKDGVCLTQRAGGGALRELADALLGEKNSHPKWLVERAREIMTQQTITKWKVTGSLELASVMTLVSTLSITVMFT